MKLVTWNLRCCDDPDGHSIDERFPRVRSVLADCQPDIVGFQEVTPKWLTYLSAYEEEGYVIFNQYRSVTNFESAPIMWKKDKYECIDKGYFWYTDTPWIESMGHDTYHCKRICIWVRLKTADEKEFFVFNTHFGFGDREQVNSVNLILQTAKVLEAENIVIVGDFNMEMDSVAYKKMTEVYADANMASIRDMGPTFHGYGREPEEHIDYCFISEDTMKVTEARVMNEMFDGKYPSDHYGLYFVIERK